jgi:hypothetical protein
MSDSEAAVVFPINRNILWSREPTGKPHYVHAREVVPPMFVDPGAMASLLRSCKGSTSSSVEKAVSVVTASGVIEGTNTDSAFCQGPWKTWLEKSTYALSLSEESNEAQVAKNAVTLCGPTVTTYLTIPISCRSSWNDDLTFDKESTR